MIRSTLNKAKVCLIALASILPGLALGAQSTAKDGWDYQLPATEFTALCDQTLDQVRNDFKAIEDDTRPATLETVFGAYDAMSLKAQAVRHVWYMKAVHPNAEFRSASEKCMQEYSDVYESHSLSTKFYRRVAAIELNNASPTERLMVENSLRDFRQSGVNLDETNRAQVRELKRKITETGNEFSRNIREDTRYIQAAPEELDGLPVDYLEARPPNEDGFVRISTDYPDYFPIMKYSTSDALRLRIYLSRQNIATPANEPVLNKLINLRHQLAQLLGYGSYAALAMDGLMIESPENANSFLTELGVAVSEPAARDMDILLQRQRQIDPKAETVQAWQSSFLANLVRQEQYVLDAQEVRQYFAFNKVQAGIFQLTEDLFRVEIVPWKTGTWHPDVTAWEIRENGAPLGRFYLDMHPRENKFKHAAHWTLRTGLAGKQLPLSGMATNFPTGLMEHGQVETYLHEFGHLLHNMFSGTQKWMSVAGMSMERDFVEAPSQMLEEWVWDYETLARFASNNEGETIPRPLVDKMVKARHFGTGISTARQIFYAHQSLNFYDRDPSSFKIGPLYKELSKRYSPYPYVEGAHGYNSFGHLNGYSSNYYMYQWSLAIATDLFSRFEQAGLRNAEVAGAYRREVLGAAGSAPARNFIADFLDRPFRTSAYIEFLNGLNSQSTKTQSR